MSNISSVNDSFFSPQKIHILRNNGHGEIGHDKKQRKETENHYCDSVWISDLK